MKPKTRNEKIKQKAEEKNKDSMMHLKTSKNTPKVELKLEDKILLTIGGMFLIFVLIFIWFATTIFNSVGEQNGSPITPKEKTLTIDEMRRASSQLHKDFEEEFYKQVALHKEDMKQQMEAFDGAKANFQIQFKKSQETFKKEP